MKSIVFNSSKVYWDPQVLGIGSTPNQNMSETCFPMILWTTAGRGRTFIVLKNLIAAGRGCIERCPSSL